MKILHFVIALCVAGALACYVWFPAPPLPQVSVDKVLVLKSQHRMILVRNDQDICSYRVAIGRSPVGPKEKAGDHKTPEGTYVLDHKNPKSGFHLAMHVSYPNPLDRERAAREGVAPGGEIIVHGIKNRFGCVGRLHRLVDWTDGCIALTNAEMDQFWTLVPEGTPIEIRP